MKKTSQRAVLLPVCLAVVGICGGVASAPALAVGVAAEKAPAAAQDIDAQTLKLLETPGVAGVATDPDGATVIYQVPGGAGELSALGLRENSRVVQLKAPITTDGGASSLSRTSAPAKAGVDATGKKPTTAGVVGGAGYLITADKDGEDPYYACSIGFVAVSPQGAPAAISAGHCASDPDSQYVSLSQPSQDPPAGGKGKKHFGKGGLGKFGFHQFGGKGDSAGSRGSRESVDISVIDITGKGYSLVPAVTDWTTAKTDNLAAGSVPITEVGPIKQGVPVTKSGRTTGSTTAKDTRYTTGWFNVSGHYVHGYGINKILVDHGDSGGAVYQGSRAVGITSGGSEDFEVAADLVTGLPLTGGYKIALAK